MNLIVKLRNILLEKGFIKQNGESKTKTVVLNVTYSLLIKVITIAVSFLSVPLLLNYLDSIQYGVWITILTFTSWFALFDLGLGNGLKNKLIEFITEGQLITAKKHVSTTYIAMALICGTISVIVFFVNPFVPWSVIFNIPRSLTASVATTTTIVLIFTMFSMVFKLINNLLHAHQQSYKVDFINFISQLAGFLALCVAKFWLKSSLITVAVMFTLSQSLVLLIANIYLFKRFFAHLVPSVNDFERSLVKTVVGVGGLFFFIQIAGIVMYMTDNFIIATLLGPQDVTIYNLALKYFSILTMAWGLLLTPLWPMVTKAYYSDDLVWIKRSIKNLLLLWLLTVGAGLFIYIFSTTFYKIWIGTSVLVPNKVNIIMLLYTCVSVFATIMATFINGIGKIRLQAYITVGLAILNIPMAILFSKVLGWGLVGIPMATTVCLAISSLLAFVQCRKIINKTSLGIWHR